MSVCVQVKVLRTYLVAVGAVVLAEGEVQKAEEKEAWRQKLINEAGGMVNESAA